MWAAFSFAWKHRYQMNKTDEIMQFFLKARFGFNRCSAREEIISAFENAADFWTDTNLICCGDMEIGFVDQEAKQEHRLKENITYFAFYPGKNHRNRFYIPSVMDMGFSVKDVDMREVMDVLVRHGIEFHHSNELAYGDRNRGLKTADDEFGSTFVKRRNRYVLHSYFCREI